MERMYEQRQKDLKGLEKKYKDLKVMYVEAMMKKDPMMQQIMTKYILENKKIEGICCWSNSVAFLCQEKLRSRKQFKGSLQTGKSKKKSRDTES